MPEEASPGGPPAVRLLLKAIRGLREREREVVLTYLLERALEPSEATPHGPFVPSFMTPAFVEEVGGVVGGMLRSGQDIAAIAGLYGIPEEVARAGLREVGSNPEAPQPLASILGLLAEGRSQAEAAGELGLSTDEVTRALEGLASSKLEGRLGRALFAHARIRSQASAAFRATAPHPGFPTGRREHGVSVGDQEPLANRIGRLLVADCGLGHIATVYDVPEDAVRAALREAAGHPDASEPLASVLKLLAKGRTRAEVASELNISEAEVTKVLEELLPSPSARRLSQALQASAVVRSAGAPPPPSLPGVTVGGSLGGEQQMVPVRFPEPQYRRLKGWCAQHGFSMAVVVRGLVERFLDDQDRRAA